MGEQRRWLIVPLVVVVFESVQSLGKYNYYLFISTLRQLYSARSSLVRGCWTPIRRSTITLVGDEAQSSQQRPALWLRQRPALHSRHSRAGG